MKSSIAFIRKELSGSFPKEEIESLIILIFDKLKDYSRTQILILKDEIILGKDEHVDILEIGKYISWMLM